MSENYNIQTEIEALKAKCFNTNGKLKSNAKAQDISRLEELEKSVGKAGQVSVDTTDADPTVTASDEAGVIADAPEKSMPISKPVELGQLSDSERITVLEAEISVIKTVLQRHGILRVGKYRKWLKSQTEKKIV